MPPPSDVHVPIVSYISWNRLTGKLLMSVDLGTEHKRFEGNAQPLTLAYMKQFVDDSISDLETHVVAKVKEDAQMKKFDLTVRNARDLLTGSANRLRSNGT